MIAAYSVNGRRSFAATAALGVLFFALSLALATPAGAGDAAAKASAHLRAGKQPALAEPTRPIALPTLPGVADSGEDGPSLHVTSTEEEDIKKQAAEDAARRAAPAATTAAATTADSEEEDAIPYSEQNWRPAKSAAAASAHDEDGEQKPQLRVRLPGLPDVRTTTPATDEAAPPPPPPSAAKASRAALLEEYKRAKAAEEIARAKQAQDEKKDKAKTPEETAACDALQAYKERQLNAIKSDNATLKALQDAISALGYEKQLNYMRGSGDMLSLPSATPAGEAATAAHDTATKPTAIKKAPAHATN